MKKHRNIIKGLVVICAFLLVTSTALFATVHIISKYPDRMWQCGREPEWVTPPGGEVWVGPTGKTIERIDVRKLYGFRNGTNMVYGRLGVVRKDGEYVVVWEPLD